MSHEIEVPSVDRSGHRLSAQLDARVWLVASAAAIAAVVSSSRPAVPLAALAGCLAVLAGARTALRTVLAGLPGPLGLAAVVCLLRTFMTGKTVWFTVGIGGWRLAATWEGLASGAMIGLRVLAAVSVMGTLVAVAPMNRLLSALAWTRLPPVVVELALLMHRHIFTLLEHATAVRTAQKVRLGYAGFRRSLSSLGNLAGLVMLRSLEQAERTHEAMLARGYQGRLPVPPCPPLGARDRRAMFAALAGAVLVYLVGERWW
jgi:cobalt/nickel transport system permease protein